ncbi:membrane binding-domain-containing protein [Xylaria palmicola]|nr:membrane binding-domain-containing protein [Xylaria palmicola]
MGDDHPPGNVAADFYEKKDYGGEWHTYSIFESDDFRPGTLLDKYHSAKVGTAVKVLVWNEPDTDGRYSYIRGRQPDLQGWDFNRLRLDEVGTHVVNFKFVDDTGGQPRDWELIVKMHDSEERTIFSNDGDSSRIAGSISASKGTVTTAIRVRNVKSSVFLANGSIYFAWNDDEAKVNIESEADWPQQLRHEQDGPSSFVITLISKEPN